MDRLITTTNRLKTVCEQLAQQSFVTVDTEFLREKTYYPKLCLVQLAGEGIEVAVDPLAEDIDLSPLFKLLSNHKVLKIFHAAKQDIEIFYQLMGDVPAPIYDTQVAAMVCGHGEQVGYEALVNKILNQSLDKASRYTDWEQRPLTQRQIDYAIADVTHLRDIYLSLRDEIAAKSREEWIVEEMAIVQSPNTYKVDPRQSWRRLKYKNRNPSYLNILRSVAGWREELAMRKDIPRGRLLKDDVVLQIAAMNPKNMEELAQVRGALKHLSADNAKAMLAAMEAARSLAPEDFPRDEKKRRMLTPQQEVLVDILKLLLKLQCDEAGVASKLVGNKDDLAAFVLREDGVAFCSGWRYELFGKLAAQFLSGELMLQAEPSGDGILFTHLSEARSAEAS